MKPAPLDWRKIEAALVKIVHAYGYGASLDQNTRTGDKIARDILIDDDTVDELNLTELAKDIAKELQA